jgi:hypothetical protein
MKHTIEELLKIAQEGKPGPSGIPTKLENDVQRFILALKIKDGKHKVKNQLLYKAYAEWSAKPFTSHQFHLYFSQFFTSLRSDTYRYHLLNYRAIELLNKIDNMKVKI